MEQIGKALNRMHPDNSQPSIQTPKIYEPEEPSEEEKRQRWLLGYGGVTSLDHTFDNLRTPPGFEETLKAFKLMAEGKAPWYMLLVYGGRGNGKSLCCEAATIRLYDRGHKAVRRQRWSDITRFTLKGAFHRREPGSRTYEEEFNALRKKPYLIIDDVGMGSTGGNWEWGELEDIVDYRLEKGLFTIITTNLDVKNLPPRIVSRFQDKRRCKLIHNKAADQRPLEGKAA